MRYSEDTIKRFWSKVNTKTPCCCHDFTNRCWIWTASTSESGYGQFHIPTGKEKPKQICKRAHRFAYELTHGTINSGVFLLHKPPCINRRCVRHCYLGTHKQNMADCQSLKRWRNQDGSRNSMATLTEEDIPIIRGLRAKGFTYPEIASWFPIGTSALSMICRGLRWSHIK